MAGTEGGGNAGGIPELKSHTRDITVMLKHAGTRLQRLGPQPRTSNACTALRNDFATHHALTTERQQKVSCKRCQQGSRKGKLTLHPLAMQRSLAPRQAWQIHLVVSLSRKWELFSKHQLQLPCILRRGTRMEACRDIQHTIRETRQQQLTLFLSASSRGPQQESTLTKLALAGIFGLP